MEMIHKMRKLGSVSEVDANGDPIAEEQMKKLQSDQIKKIINYTLQLMLDEVSKIDSTDVFHEFSE